MPTDRPHSSRAGRYRPRLEELEDRRLMSWAGVPPVQIQPPQFALPVFLNINEFAQGVGAIESGEEEYFSFVPGLSGNFRLTAVDFQSAIDTVIGVFDADGNRIAFNDDVSANEKWSDVNVTLQAGNRYYLGVTNYTGQPMGQYAWYIDGPDDDHLENNDTFAAPHHFGTPQGLVRVDNLRLNDSADWYRFTMTSTGSAAHYVSTAFFHSQGDIDIRLFAADGTQVRSSEGNLDGETISLNGLAPGTYTLVAFGFRGAVNPNYSLFINPATRTAADDRFENNDDFLHAFNLGVMPAAGKTYTGLALQDVSDWYRFTMTGNGTAASHVRVTFSHAAGDVELALYSLTGELIRRSDGATNAEQISLNGLSAGTYVIKVHGYNGANNPRYDLTIRPGTARVVDDRFEGNDTRAAARNLGTLARFSGHANLVMADSADWYRFSMPGRGSANHYVRINFLHSRGDLDLELYNAAGGRIAASRGALDGEVINLNGRAPGTYYVRVYGFRGVTNPRYSLLINPGGVATDDVLENNDTLAAATDLGTLRTSRVIRSLAMADGGDWFRFSQQGVGTVSSYVQAAFTHARGDLDLELYDSRGRLLRRANGNTNLERLPLQGRGVGTYYVRVFGFRGAKNPAYTLTISPGTGLLSNNARVLYVNFDGAFLSRSTLLRISADWQIGVDNIDADQNGITVRAWQAGRANRERLISRAMSLLTADLRPFGITPRRHRGQPVENINATTMYVGMANYTPNVPGVAGDVDFGNNNRTDICFVQDGAGRGDNDLVQATADFMLHEAGHTYGLYHVDSPGTNEGMGFGYSANTYAGMNVAFLDRVFPEYQNHGGNSGPQNSYRALLVNIRGNAAAAGPGNPRGALFMHLDTLTGPHGGAFIVPVELRNGQPVKHYFFTVELGLKFEGLNHVHGVGAKDHHAASHYPTPGGPPSDDHDHDHHHH